MSRTKTSIAKRGRRSKSARHSSKNYQQRVAPSAASPGIAARLEASENPLAGWTDLRVIAHELGIAYRELRRNVPHDLVKPLGRRRYVQRERFVRWWSPPVPS